MKHLGDKIVNEKYAATLEKVADDFDALNDGSLSQQFIRDIQKRGGVMTPADLKNYKVLIKDPLKIQLPSLNLIVHTTPLPGGGTVLKHILDIAKGKKNGFALIIQVQFLTFR